ncbi:SAC3 family protein B isoform X4 [Manihot esculenta]|uniref:PCI domain-containing protein n=3 Tax=Manihot esculenta TaxID=3983 RepID=A0A2C9W8Z4_MANES|nr:SAC3 family protein B isoform X4 [Manihot esculenta]OAY55893.1 hypothetical protein MANES_03G187900v8 [Manihot esculenta]
MSGFGKHSGPSGRPSPQPRFGDFPRLPSPSPYPPKSPPFFHSSPVPASRSPVATERVLSPPLSYEGSSLAANASQSAGIPRRPEALGRVRSPPLSFKSTHPVANPSFGAHRSTLSPSQWVNGQSSLSKDDDQTNLTPSAVASFVASRNAGTSVTAKISRFPEIKRTRSPPSQALDEDISRNPRQTFLQRPALYQSEWDNQHKLMNNYPNLLAHQDHSPVSPFEGSHGSARSFVNDDADVHVPKQARSPPVSPADGVLQKETRRSSTSPPRLGARSNAFSSTSGSQISQKISPSANTTAIEAAPTRNTNYSVAKRTRSPPFPASDKAFQGNSYSDQDGAEREIQAKAKRLARFKEELGEKFENRTDIAEKKVSASGRERYIIEKQKFAGNYSMESGGDFSNGDISSDCDGLGSSGIIIGLCPDMCPESEREERERKGDLDQYERLDGDRNQTTKFLAVKKYTRTAEREASLIRPMPILQKTIDYLLNLLDQPYDDRFLGTYNFLWDRMRAIRMDLRMQHIFNLEAITMLEEMIRLHIIAMHELCEYTKGEGFSEGFDAHLNIEQMNKTSVELFQMYDDHRKKGINVPTEQEFRGYYALLKLDKHPGYKVEPAELSLDLAKMSPEIRQMPEVLFARDVARACRTGNFVAFFRLARKARYLQACLMHAHFAKLRTQALASLHCGLQNNQGLPVAHVANWLAMEEEDIESLLEHHGFSIKEFEEPYMVKEGPFLNGDQDYPTKRSKLVHQKISRRIVDDVSPTSQVASLPAQASREIQLPTVCKHDKKPVASTFMERKGSTHAVDEEMPDFQVVSSPKVGTKLQPVIDTSKVGQQSQEDRRVEGSYFSPWGFSLVHSPLVNLPAKFNEVEKLNDNILSSISPEKKMLSGMEDVPLQVVSRASLQEISPSAKYGYVMENKVPVVVCNDTKDEPPDNHEMENDEVLENYDDEVAQAKLKLIIRLWRRRASKQRELREQRQIVANAALSSLSLGPPIRKAKDQLSTTTEFDIEHVMRERYEKHKQSWSSLNVSDVIVDILGKRNPTVGCLCWKIVLCSQQNNQGDKVVAAGPWLLSKIMPSKKDDNLLISSSGMSIWKKWVPSQSGNDLTCCLSVVRDVMFDDLNETIDGASAILFVVSESIPLNTQKAQLHNLLMSVPSDSCLPLLILCGSCNIKVSDPSSTIVSELGLHDIEKSRISSFLIVFLTGDTEKEYLDGFFSDERLREGLRWLASESLVQPDICCIKTRELILTHLNPLLDVLDKKSVHALDPNHCISAFNEALDWSLGEIAAAAKSKPIGWPCPEIALLQESCDEHMVVRWYLPSIGWSSAARIEPLVSALRECKLPTFPDPISLSGKGAKSGEEIENLKSQLENCLIHYMTQSSGMMTPNLAIKEAQVMLQKCARLELHDSSYYIIPKWISVFRRIFNWRLTSLSSGAVSSAYVLRHHHVDPTPLILDEFGLEGNESLPYINQPSLDEIIVGCTPLVPTRDEPQLEAFQPQQRRVSNGDVCGAGRTNDLMEDESASAQFDRDNHVNAGGVEATVAGQTTKEADKLTKLLEQCSILQNSIEEKLYIYF